MKERERKNQLWSWNISQTKLLVIWGWTVDPTMGVLPISLGFFCLIQESGKWSSASSPDVTRWFWMPTRGSQLFVTATASCHNPMPAYVRYYRSLSNACLCWTLEVNSTRCCVSAAGLCWLLSGVLWWLLIFLWKIKILSRFIRLLEPILSEKLITSKFTGTPKEVFIVTGSELQHRQISTQEGDLD